MKHLLLLLLLTTNLVVAENQQETQDPVNLQSEFIHIFCESYGEMTPQGKLSLTQKFSRLIVIEIQTIELLKIKGIPSEIQGFQVMNSLKNTLIKYASEPPKIEGWISTPHPWIPMDLVGRLPFYMPGMDANEIQDPKLRQEYEQAITNDLATRVSISEKALIDQLEHYLSLFKND